MNIGVGHDGVHSLFLKNASEDILMKLAHFLNTCFVHCYLPTDLLKGNVTLIIKDRKGNNAKSNNHRSTMQSSCILKIYEIIMLNIMKEKITLNGCNLVLKKAPEQQTAVFFLRKSNMIIREETSQELFHLLIFPELLMR